MRTLGRTRKAGSVQTTASANPLKNSLILFGIFVLLLACVGRGLAQTTIPDTPAGKVLRAWLDAFNSGDRAKIEAYIKTFEPKQSADFMLTFRGQTGGFDLLAIETSEPKLIKFRVKEKASPTVGIGSIQLNDAQPPTVENFGIRAIPPGAVVENIRLDAAARQRVLDGVESNLKESSIRKLRRKWTTISGVARNAANMMPSPMAMFSPHSSPRICRKSAMTSICT